MAKKQRMKKNSKMRRTVLGALSAVFMGSALIVAAIPSSKSEAANEEEGIEYSDLNYYDKPYALNPASASDKNAIIARQKQYESRDVAEIIPICYDASGNPSSPVYFSEDGLFSIAYAPTPGQATYTGVIVNFDITNPDVSSTLEIPDSVLAYQYDNTGNLQAVCGNATGIGSVPADATQFLYYNIGSEGESVSGNQANVQYTMRPCYAAYKADWFKPDGAGYNKIPMYMRYDSKPSGNGVVQGDDGKWYKPSELMGGQLRIPVQYIGSRRYNPSTQTYEDKGVFQDATQMSTLKIKSNILAIGDNAFVNCQFNTVNLGNKLQRIGNYAFYNCNQLSTLNLYDEDDKDESAVHASTALNVIGACAFSGCRALRNVVIPNQVQSLGLFCFANDTSMTAANLYGLDQDGNTNLTKVGDGLFLNCSNLQVLHLANNVANIDYVEYLLYDCSSLYELYLPDNVGGISSVEPLSGSAHIGVFAANNVTGCSGLMTVKVPNNATKIECGTGSGLEGDGNKYNLHIDNPSYPYEITGASHVDAFGKINLGCHLNHPEEYEVGSSFVIISNRSEACMAYKYARAHEIAFGYVDSGVEYYEKVSEQYFYTIKKPSGGNTVVDLAKITVESGNTGNIIIPSTIGPYTIGSISGQSFASLGESGKNAISYVNIPYTVSLIGDNTFNGCTNLEAIHFDDAMSVEEIGNKAFYTGAGSVSGNGLKELKLIGTVSSGKTLSEPFQYAMTVGNTYNDPTVSESKYITYCTDFPTNLQIKLDYDYDPVDNTIINPTPTLVGVPKGVSQYTGGTPDYSLTSYDKQKEAQNKIAESALKKYGAGTSFGGLTEAEQGVITATTVINVPYGVRAVADEALDGKPVFSGNEDLITLQLNSVENLQDGLMNDCTKLVNFTMGSSGVEGGESVGSYVFENCPSLTNVSMPDTLTTFGQVPFHGATALTYVDFGNSPYYTCDDYIIYGLDENGQKDRIVECLRVRGKAAGTSFVTNSNFAGVSQIEPYAFLDCDGVLTADMSGSEVEKIPEHCFDSCVNLYQCTLPDSTTEIESCAFKDTKIRSITIPNNFAHISDTAFVDGIAGTDTVKDVANLLIRGYSPSTAENYANSKNHPTFTFEKVSAMYTVNFVDGYDNAVLHTEQVAEGGYITQVTWAPPTHDNVIFDGWDPADYYENPVTSNMTIKATYTASGEANYTLTFVDWDEETVLYKMAVVRDGYATAPPIPAPYRDGYTFIGWTPSNYTTIPIIKDMKIVAQYYYTGDYKDNTNDNGNTGNNNGSVSDNNTDEDLNGQSTNKNTTSADSKKKKNTSNNGSGNDSGNTNTNKTNNGSDTGSNGTNNSTTTKTNTTVNNTTARNNGRTVSGNGTTVKRPNGTKVEVTKSGINNSKLVSATVSGGNGDNYVIKITDSEEAKSAVQKALLGEYGNIDNIKYFAMDISIYDATGTTKLENIAGLSVNITMPIPEALTVYGGNNRAAAVSGAGALEKLGTRFTTIDGVPCMSFTATHFSPYSVYVDTNNLTAAGAVDVTPKTGDPIEPKWFLAMGLALLSIITFFMRGSKRKVIKVVS